jgi:hypothetical protein
VASEPVASEPVASEPVASEPVASEPVASEPVASEPVHFIYATEEQRTKFKNAFVTVLKKLVDDGVGLITNQMVSMQVKSLIPDSYIEYAPSNYIHLLITQATAKPYVIFGQDSISIIKNL